jgi:hypothetical protein
LAIRRSCFATRDTLSISGGPELCSVERSSLNFGGDFRMVKGLRNFREEFFGAQHGFEIWHAGFAGG